jgi:hypothetical protein
MKNKISKIYHNHRYTTELRMQIPILVTGLNIIIPEPLSFCQSTFKKNPWWQKPSSWKKNEGSSPLKTRMKQKVLNMDNMH